jgi:predicted metal-dependent phosphoesterase TrpH
MLRADLHVHTKYSYDSNMSLESIVNRCLKVGINCVAIADHGTIVGALELKEIAPFEVIVAEEILTPLGEIMGLFLRDEIPSGISAEEAIAQIRAQKGLVCLPHPFDRLRGIGDYQEMEKLLPQIDIIEVFNSRVMVSGPNRKAQLFAQEHGLLCSAGSDAHIPHEIGRAYVEMPEFNGSDEFRAALAQGKIFGRRSCPLVHIPTMWLELKRRLPRRKC